MGLTNSELNIFKTYKRGHISLAEALCSIHRQRFGEGFVYRLDKTDVAFCRRDVDEWKKDVSALEDRTEADWRAAYSVYTLAFKKAFEGWSTTRANELARIAALSRLFGIHPDLDGEIKEIVLELEAAAQADLDTCVAPKMHSFEQWKTFCLAEARKKYDAALADWLSYQRVFDNQNFTEKLVKDFLALTSPPKKAKSEKSKSRRKRRKVR